MAKEIETGWGAETEMRDGGSENEAATDEAEIGSTQRGRKMRI